MRKFWLTDYEPEVQRELFRLGHHNLSGAMPGGLVSISLVTWLTWGTVAPDTWGCGWASRCSA